MENKILTKDNVEETEKDKPVDSPKVTENQSEDKKVKIGKAKKKISYYTCSNRNNIWSLLAFIWKKLCKN